MKITQRTTLVICFSMFLNPVTAAIYTGGVYVSNTVFSASTGLINAPDVGGEWSIAGSKLEPIGLTASVGQIWYEADEYDVIDQEFTTIGTEFASNHTYYLGGSITVTPNTAFYMAFWLDTNMDSIANKDDRYGWAQLEYDGSSINLLRSAFTDSGSIEVGVVPEPSTIGMFLSGALLLTAFTRRTE